MTDDNYFRRQTMMRQLPNIMTLLNLLCGCVALTALFENNIPLAGLMILIAGILDFFDGFVARLLGVTGDLGKQLDSLADMVTFGVVPGVLMYQLFLKSNFLMYMESARLFKAASFTMFSVTLFSALRLAKFNIDARQKNYFIGVPTPANTIGLFSLAWSSIREVPVLSGLVNDAFFLLLSAIISSLLMVAEIPLIALKFKGKPSPPQLILLLFSVLFILLFGFTSPLVILIFYVILSLLFPPVKKSTL